LFTELGVDSCGDNCDESLRKNTTKYNDWTKAVVSAIRQSGGNNANRVIILASPKKDATGIQMIVMMMLMEMKMIVMVMVMIVMMKMMMVMIMIVMMTDVVVIVVRMTIVEVTFRKIIIVIMMIIKMMMMMMMMMMTKMKMMTVTMAIITMIRYLRRGRCIGGFFQMEKNRSTPSLKLPQL